MEQRYGYLGGHKGSGICTIEGNIVLAKKEGIKCLGTIQATLGTNTDCRYIVLKGYMDIQRKLYLVSKKQCVTGGGQFMIEGRYWFMKDMDDALRWKE